MIKELKIVKTEAKTYRPFDLKTSPGLYISVVPTERSQQDIATWAKDLGLPLSVKELSDLHCTIVYSKIMPSSWPKLCPEEVYAARLLGVEWWDGHDDSGYVVMKLGSADLTSINQAWTAAGCVNSFEPYQPHVTLKKDVGPLPRDFMERRKRLYRTIGTGLTFTRITLEGLKTK